VYHLEVLCEIVTIGDEICRGEIVDTNAAYLAAELWDLDLTVAWMTSCRDEDADIRRALETAAARAELVLVSGGLGPTEDDLTVDVAAALIGAEAVVHEPSLASMRARYEAIGYAVTPKNLRQVRAPAGARVYPNPAGAAPAFEVDLRGTPIFFAPGFPRELAALFETALKARICTLRDGRDGGAEHIARRRYRTFGKGESVVAAALEGIAEVAPDVSIHYQVKFPEVYVKAVARHRDPEVARTALDAFDGEIRARLGRHLFGTDDESLPKVLGDTLSARKLKLAVAESCTGGLVGSLITEVPGSSAYFVGGAITYANAEKVRQLGVSEATLEARGAVSEAVALEMARGIRERTSADLAAAVTGVAGPGGGTEEKPVGLVWLAVAGPTGERQKRLMWPGSRDQIRMLSAYWAMWLCLEAALGGGEVAGG
jgi:nicotinamide-nucleotide amidase